MIGVDISNVWGEVSLQELLALEADVAAAHEALPERPEDVPQAERILAAASRIREDSQVCVILGIDGWALAARGILELLQKGWQDSPRILFAGNTLSTRQWNGLKEELEGRDFSVIVLSASGADMETGIALRGLRWMLERKHGTDKASRRIYAVTAPEQGTLGTMAKEAGWEVFEAASGSALTASLLPLAVAGVDIEEMVRSAREAEEEFDLRSLENPLWQYVAVRNLMYRSGKAVELISAWEPDFSTLGRWWQQLFAAVEGREGKGLLPVPVELPGERLGLGQLALHGRRNLFETMVRFASTGAKHTVGSQWNDPDGLNYLEGKTLDQVEEDSWFETVDAHAAAGVPVITVDCGEPDGKNLARLIRFLELSCAISAGVLGVVHSETTEE